MLRLFLLGVLIVSCGKTVAKLDNTEGWFCRTESDYFYFEGEDAQENAHNRCNAKED